MIRKYYHLGIICFLFPAYNALTHTQNKWIQPSTTRRYDQVCFLTAHNAHANKNSGWQWYAQQTWDLRQQLENGIRGLMLDIYEHDNEIKLCHGKCTGIYGFQRCFKAGIATLCGYDPGYQTLSQALTIIHTWLMQNPQEIVTIFLENYVSNESLHAYFMRMPTITSLIFDPKEWRNSHEPWPTLSWMISHNKRLVVFNENKSKTSIHQHHIFSDTYHHVIESQYSTLQHKRVVTERKESLYHTAKNRHLFLLNFFSLITSSRKKSRYNNSYKKLKTVLDDCKKSNLAHGKMPNFIALDHVDQGDAMRLVNELNGYTD